MSVLSRDLRIGDTLVLGPFSVTLEAKTGQVARLRIDAPRDVVVRQFPPAAVRDLEKLAV